MKTKQTITAAIFGGLLFAAGPALADNPVCIGGIATGMNCETAKYNARMSIENFEMSFEKHAEYIDETCETVELKLNIPGIAMLELPVSSVKWGAIGDHKPIGDRHPSHYKHCV